VLGDETFDGMIRVDEGAKRIPLQAKAKIV
jgi:hypothetical protein